MRLEHLCDAPEGVDGLAARLVHESTACGALGSRGRGRQMAPLCPPLAQFVAVACRDGAPGQARRLNGARQRFTALTGTCEPPRIVVVPATRPSTVTYAQLTQEPRWLNGRAK